MSAEPNVITCSQCGFKTSSRRIWGNFQYQMPDGATLHVSRTVGWCHACANIEPIETFPEKTHTETELADLRKQRKRADTFRWFKSSRDKAERIDEEIREKELVMRFLELRSEPPRCLSCGCTEVVPVDVPSVDGSEVVRMNFVHPGCGGAFAVNNSGVRLAMSFPLRLYDHNGNAIE